MMIADNDELKKTTKNTKQKKTRCIYELTCVLTDSGVMGRSWRRLPALFMKKTTPPPTPTTRRTVARVPKTLNLS